LERFGNEPADVQTESKDKAGSLEARFFFLYLSGDFAASLKAFEGIEARVDQPERRLAALGLKAQILWSMGEQSRAQGMIDYLVAALGPQTKRVDETPQGPVVTKELTPKQAWARYLAQRAAAPVRPASPQAESLPLEESPDHPFRNPFVPPDPMPIEGRGNAAPFAPGLTPLNPPDR
jgi:hypothetical protein